MLRENESLVIQAKESKKLPNILWAIVLTLVFMYGGQIIGGILLGLIISLTGINPEVIVNGGFLSLLISLVSFAFISLLVFFRVKKIEKRSLASIGFSKNSWLKKYSFGFLIGLIMMSLVVILLYLFGCVTIEKQSVQPVGVSSIGFVVVILIGWVIQGGTEEVLTRGWLMNVIGARYNIALGLAVSSSLFGLLHLGNPNVNLVAILNIILVGLFFGLYVMKTNDLWAVCGMHSAWNFAQGNIFGFEVSGLNVQVGTLVDLNLVGNDIVSGGVFGPEAGLCATIILITSILVLYIWNQKLKKND